MKTTTASLFLLCLAAAGLASAQPVPCPPCYDALGAYQSPIEFNAAKGCVPSLLSSAMCPPFVPPHFATDLLRFKVTYADVGTVEQNIKFYNAAPAGAGIVFQGVTYYLIEFHFHSPSEHTFTGPTREFQMELHLVFRSTPDSHDKLPGVVIGVPIVVSRELTPFDRFLDKLLSSNLANGAPVEVSSGLFTSCLHYNNHWNFPPSFVYPGSLTTEPYAEGVTWIVVNGHVAQTARISQATLNKFLALQINGARIGHSRPVQKIYSRPIVTVTPP